MREIKFRVWFKDEKEMSEPFNIEDLHTQECYEEGDYYVLTPDNDILYGVGREIWLQHTGLKDKNGKEIYEGDIICEVGRTASGDKVRWEYEVCFGIYDNGEEYDDRTAGNGWYLKSIPKNYISEFMNIDGFTTKLVIIGNIYENSELLKCDK